MAAAAVRLLYVRNHSGRKLRQILTGFDFSGLLLVPIRIFEYLQNAAEGFARGAIKAESQFVNFTVRQQADEATGQELETAIAMAHAEADSASRGGRPRCRRKAAQDRAALCHQACRPDRPLQAITNC